MPMSSINRVVLVGNLTRDPELRAIASTGHSVCHLRVACNSRRKVNDKEWADRPHYFDVSVFGPQAESSHRYLRKGRPVAIDGRLEFREWVVEGHKRQAVSIVADTVQFLGTPEPRPAGEASAAEASTAESNAANGAPQGAAEPQAETTASTPNGAGNEPIPVAAGTGLGEEGAAEDQDDPEDLTF